MSDSIIKKFNMWEEKLNKAIDFSMEDEVYEITKDVMKSKIATDVYEKYSPTEYIRRYEKGGLLDDKNIVKTYLPSNKTLFVKNITDKGFTVNVVESGVGYTWKGSKIYKSQPFPRPFHKPAEDELIRGGWAKEALMKGIRRRGIK